MFCHRNGAAALENPRYIARHRDGLLLLILGSIPHGLSAAVPLYLPGFIS